MKELLEADKNKQNSLRVWSLSELLTTDIGEPDWLVDGMLPLPGTSILCGKPKKGKSTLSRNLALAVSRGESFLSKATKKGNVLYIAVEESIQHVKKHFEAMDATEEQEIHIITDMLPKNPLGLIEELIRHVEPSLLIIDPLFRCIRVKDGNEYCQVINSIEPYLQLAKGYNLHIMFLHYAKKGDSNGMDSILGSSGILASIDTSIMLDENSMGIRIFETKQRYGESIPRCGLVFNEATRMYSLGDVALSSVDIDTRVEEEIISLITNSQEEDLNQEEIVNSVTGKKDVIIKALNKLCESENSILLKDGSGFKGSPYTYRIRS